MLKVMAMLGGFLMILTAMAGDVYERTGTVSEYPARFRAARKVQLKLRTAPTQLLKPTVACVVPAGRVIGYSELQRTTQVQRVRENATGRIVENLSYLAEGVCVVREDGQTREDSCFQGSDRFTELNEIVQESWHYVRCEAGVRGWATEAELNDVPGLTQVRQP